MPVKYFFPSLILICCAQLAVAQLCFPVKKVFAYFQPVTAGTMSREEAGKRQQRGNQLIYITSKAGDVQLKNIWINGVLHHGNFFEVASPVFAAPADKNKNIMLVPATKQKTYQVIFTALDSGHVNTVLPKKYSSLPMVMEVQYKNRKKFIKVDSIKQLDTMPLN